jgi:hypothetical protein
MHGKLDPAGVCGSTIYIPTPNCVSHFLTFVTVRGSNSASVRFPMILAFVAFSSTVFKL